MEISEIVKMIQELKLNAEKLTAEKLRRREYIKNPKRTINIDKYEDTTDYYHDAISSIETAIIYLKSIIQ